MLGPAFAFKDVDFLGTFSVLNELIAFGGGSTIPWQPLRVGNRHVPFLIEKTNSDSRQFLVGKNKTKFESEREHLTVIGATSGDTGSDAIYGLRRKKLVTTLSKIQPQYPSLWTSQ